MKSKLIVVFALLFYVGITASGQSNGEPIPLPEPPNTNLDAPQYNYSYTSPWIQFGNNYNAKGQAMFTYSSLTNWKEPKIWTELITGNGYNICAKLKYLNRTNTAGTVTLQASANWSCSGYSAQPGKQQTDSAVDWSGCDPIYNPNYFTTKGSHKIYDAAGNKYKLQGGSLLTVNVNCRN